MNQRDTLPCTMNQTRREFLITSAAALSVAAAPLDADTDPVSARGPAPHPTEPAWMVGDPYIASACTAGFGGRSFDAARDHALRFRMPDHERDRLLLGLEL